MCCYRPLSGPFGPALLILLRLFAAHVRSSLQCSLQSITLRGSVITTLKIATTDDPCPGSLLIWKALNTVQNQTPFSVVGSSWFSYSGSKYIVYSVPLTIIIYNCNLLLYNAKLDPLLIKARRFLQYNTE